jgi:hypothetical protein
VRKGFEKACNLETSNRLDLDGLGLLGSQLTALEQ